MVEYTEFLSATLAVTNTYAETTINVPTPRLGGGGYGRYRSAVAMVIHKVEIDMALTGSALDAAADYCEIQLTKQSKTAEVQLTDGDLIIKEKWIAWTASTSNFDNPTHVIYTMNPPVLVAGQKLFLGGIADEAANGGTCYIRIWYTMRNVAESDLVRTSIV